MTCMIKKSVVFSLFLILRAIFLHFECNFSFLFLICSIKTNFTFILILCLAYALIFRFAYKKIPKITFLTVFTSQVLSLIDFFFLNKIKWHFQWYLVHCLFCLRSYFESFIFCMWLKRKFEKSGKLFLRQSNNWKQK